MRLNGPSGKVALTIAFVNKDIQLTQAEHPLGATCYLFPIVKNKAVLEQTAVPVFRKLTF